MVPRGSPNQVHMNIAAKLDVFAEEWRIGQSDGIANLNLESEVDE